MKGRLFKHKAPYTGAGLWRLCKAGGCLAADAEKKLRILEAKGRRPSSSRARGDPRQHSASRGQCWAIHGPYLGLGTTGVYLKQFRWGRCLRGVLCACVCACVKHIYQCTDCMQSHPHVSEYAKVHTCPKVIPAG